MFICMYVYMYVCMHVCTKSFLKTTTNSSCVCTQLANKADSDSDSDSDSDPQNGLILRDFQSELSNMLLLISTYRILVNNSLKPSRTSVLHTALKPGESERIKKGDMTECEWVSKYGFCGSTITLSWYTTVPFSKVCLIHLCEVQAYICITTNYNEQKHASMHM